MKTLLNKPILAGIGIACATLLAAGLLIRSLVAQAQPGPPPSVSATDRLAAGRYFPERLLWVGQTAPTEAESQLLEGLLNECKGRGTYEAVGELEEFLATLPDSAWAASLRCNLAYYYRVRGRYTLALQHWQAAWEATRHFEAGAGRRIADYTLIHWTQLLASLGRVEELESLFAETDDRRMSLLSWQHKWNKSLGAYSMMKRHPEISYRCGTVALMRVAGALSAKSITPGKLAEIPSPSTGFSLAYLLEIAREHGIQVEAVARLSGEELVVPSVIHWKQNHYAAITERRGEMYLVEDPTFGRPQWLRAEVINEEASGYFLVPASLRPLNTRVLSLEECASIYGKGMNYNDPPAAPPPCPEEGQDACDCPPNPPPPNSPPPNPPPPNSPPPNSPPPNSPPRDSDCGSCGENMPLGMAHWTVTEPYISLWLHDQPMSYQSVLGGAVTLKLSYHQRETRPADGDVFNFGPYWNCNWLTYLDVSDYFDDPELEYYEATLYGSRGGERTYLYSNTDPEYRSRTRLERNVEQSELTGFTMLYLDAHKSFDIWTN
jgi:hypothetical protein